MRTTPDEIPAGYVWGVFKNSSGYYANYYFKEMSYPTMVKGNLTKEEAQKLVEEMSQTQPEP